MSPFEATLFILLLLCLRSCSSSYSSTRALEKVESDMNSQITCAQVLIGCRVKDEVMERSNFGPVHLTGVKLEPVLCCVGGTHCVPCVKIVTHLMLTENDAPSGQQDLSGDSDDNSDAEDDEDDDDEYDNGGREEGSISHPDAPPTPPMIQNQPTEIHVSLSVRYTVPGLLPVSKRVEFMLPPAGRKDQSQLEVWFSLVVSKKVSFSSQLKVWIHQQNFSLTFPSKKEVCFSELQRDVAECDVPALRTVVDWDNAVVTLQLDNQDTQPSLDVGLNIKYSELNRHSYQQWKNSVEQITIPLTSVVPCTCFLVWWIRNDSLRGQSCPFLNHTELLQNVWDNVSVSMSPSKTRDNATVLTWAVSAPCRMDAELWPCWKEPGKGGCREVMGKRQGMQNENQKNGRFSNLQPHPSLCVKITVKGKNVELGPFCPFAAARSRWSLVVLFTIIAASMGVLLVYLLRNSLKRWAAQWLKGGNIRGAVAGCEVVLLCPPDPDPRVTALMCHLGSSLSELGFCVSLDLWSGAELGALGPVPWLHSRLHRLQRHRGKVVLLLTQTAWQRAAQWGCYQPQSAHLSPPHVDVFSASLSCVMADSLQGRAGERFVLVQCESLPPVLLGAGQPLPELFRGLALYSLPSQSLGFLTELAGATRDQGQSWRRMASSLKAGSRTLALGLRGLGSAMVGDTLETVPLQSCNQWCQLGIKDPAGIGVRGKL